MTMHACLSSPCPTCNPAYTKWCGHTWWTPCYCTRTWTWPSTATTLTFVAEKPADGYVGRHRPEYVRPSEV